MRAEETRTDPQFGRVETLINAAAQNSSREILAATCRRRGVLSTTTGPLVVAAVFCLVFLVMGAAFSFSTFAGELERDLEAGSGAVSFIFGCAMALLYAGGLFSGPLADRIGTHRVAGAGALLAGGSLVAAGAVGRVWEADITLGLGFGLGLAICYTPAVAAVQPWFDRNRGVASGIALSGTGLGTLLMPLLARWLIDSDGWRLALIVIGLGVAGFGFVASNWIRRPPELAIMPSSQRSTGSLRKLIRAKLPVALHCRVSVVFRASRAYRSYDPSRRSRWCSPARCGVAGLDPRVRLSRRPAHPRSCCGPAWTQAYLGRAPHCVGHAVSDLDSQGGLRHNGPLCVRLRCLLRRDDCAAAGSRCRPFCGRKFGHSDRPALHELRYRAAHWARGVRILDRPLEQRRDCQLRGCGLPGRCRLFLRSKTPSNSIARDDSLAASLEEYEDAGPYRLLDRAAFGNVRRLMAAEWLFQAPTR